MKIENLEIKDILTPIMVKIREYPICIKNSIGEISYYSSHFTERFIELDIKITDVSILNQLRNIIIEQAKFSKNIIQIETDVDLGMGEIINVRYWSKEFVYEYDDVGIYKIKLLFRLEE